MANDINLIPPPDLEKKKQTNKKALWMGLVIAAVILVGYFGVYSPLETRGRLTKELDQLLEDGAGYQQVLDAHTELTGQINDTKTKLAELEGNLPEAFGWSGLFKEIEECLPADVSFTSMDFQDTLLYMQGNYKKDVDLSRLIVKLRALSMVEGARILSVTLNEDGQTYAFEISCDLPASAYPDTTAETPAPEAGVSGAEDSGDGTGEGAES